jgi:hypothetical protein
VTQPNAGIRERRLPACIGDRRLLACNADWKSEIPYAGKISALPVPSITASLPKLTNISYDDIVVRDIVSMEGGGNDFKEA